MGAEYTEVVLMSGKLFILAGNGSYENRGCEAIIRGTVEILRRHFDDPKFLVCSHFSSMGQLLEQQRNEFDPALRHVAVQRLLPSRSLLLNRVRSLLHQKFPRLRQRFLYRSIKESIAGACAILSVGGDNYTLDYGIPTLFTDLDDHIVTTGGKIIIWGSSVGPFSRIPAYEKYMAEHLKCITTIFARETATISYLRTLGIERNVVKTVDPAFVMKAQMPPDWAEYGDLSGTIGLNLTPLMARYCSQGDETLWLGRAVEIVAAVEREFAHPILLIPHVFESGSDDWSFLEKVRLAVGSRRVTLLSGHYRAAELKWFISQLLLLAAARTHATIAGFSSFVPTISFAYSIKATGLNQDIYGNQDLCLYPDAIHADTVCDKISRVIDRNSNLRALLVERVTPMFDEAFNSGQLLNEIIGL